MNFYELNPEQALLFLDHVVASEPYRLGLLAERMMATGGPIGEMDASVASLVPAWRWFMRFAEDGLPGVRRSVAPSLTPELVGNRLTDEVEHARRWSLVAEGLAHYVALVVRRIDAGARWELYLQKGRVLEGSHQEPMVQLSDGTFIDPLTFVPVIAAQYFVRRDLPYARSADRLRKVLVMRLPELADLRQEPGPSVLEQYLPYADAELPPAVAVSPLALWAGEAPASPPAAAVPAAAGTDDAEQFGAELTLAVGPAAGLEDPRLLRPLPVDLVAGVLAGLDLTHPDGTPATAADLLTPGLQLFAEDGTAMVETDVADGALRALYMEPAGGGTAAHWNRIEDRLQALATELGGHMVAVGPEDWPEP